MEISSEYTFPIFISSTDYNLIDLRAELADYLRHLGYRPILSSADGFPDSFPDMEPWESCLPVLDSCFVMILIIDGRYGTPLDWPFYKELFKDRKVSPTHGEYLFAHFVSKRMLVFVRRDIMAHYQSYRAAVKESANIEEARKLLQKTLPKEVAFETLQLVEEVKTCKPIPWVKSFADVTSIKLEVQRKMLNELAEVFLIKNKHLETVVQAFSKVMVGLSPEKRNEVLQSIGVTKSLVDHIETQTGTINGLTEKVDTLNKQLQESQSEIEKARKAGKDNSDLKSNVTKLQKERDELQKRIEEFERANASFIIGSRPPGFPPGSIGTSAFSAIGGSLADAAARPLGTSLSGKWSEMLARQKCDSCGRSLAAFGMSQLRTCPKCNRKLCATCWPFTFAGMTYPEICPKCRDEAGKPKPVEK